MSNGRKLIADLSLEGQALKDIAQGDSSSLTGAGRRLMRLGYRRVKGIEVTMQTERKML